MNITIEDIENLPDDHPVRVALVGAGGLGYEAFCDRVEDSILSAIEHVEKGKGMYSKLGEDAISCMIIFALGKDGLNADHDAFRNGHCDILVKKGRFEWYGEAKLDNGPKYVLGGFRQLTDRYAPAGPTTNRGGLLVYTKQPNKLARLNGWLKEIQNEFESPITLLPVCMNTLTGRTTHTHPASGLEFRVRHFPVSMYHRPTD